MNGNLTPAPKPGTPERLMQMAWGYAPTLIVHAALKAGVFDRLHEAPRSLTDLTKATGASERGLKAVANALVGLNLLAREGEVYRLTPDSAAYLVASQKEYRGGFFEHHVEHLLPDWMELAEVLRTGHPASHTNRETGGAEHFARFVESLFPNSYAAASALGRHLGLAQTEAPVSVLDLGAGSGVWGIALAEQSPQVRVRAVDWPRVLEITRQVAARHGVADRLTLAPGDFVTADFGMGHQVATLGHILHSEGPERSRQLLRRTFAALAPGGLIAIQEFMPDDDRRGPSLPLIFAVNMLVNTEEGDTFTFEEMSVWLTEAGFINPRRLPVPSVSPLVLADRPA